MRNHRLPRYTVFLGVVATSALTLALSLTWSVPTALAAGPANAQATELVRLINGERAHFGKAPLRTDSFLAIKARDGAVACPNDATKVMPGRAKDFAVYGFGANAHLLRLCPTYTSMDAMKAWGYNTPRGEITALNGGYGNGKVAYSYGCTPSVRACPGAATSTYSTTAHAMANWTSSPTHYSIIVGSYDRIGCGAWIGSNGAYYYDCMASRGGRIVPKSRPAAAGNQAAATQAGATSGLSFGGLGMPGDEMPPVSLAAGSAASSPAGSTAPANDVQGTSSPKPVAVPVGGTAKGGPQSDPPGGNAGAPVTSRNLSVAAGAFTAMFSLLYGLLMALRRRRPRRRPAG